MAALPAGVQYALSSEASYKENKELVFVKLTDSALKAIEDFIRNNRVSTYAILLIPKQANNVRGAILILQVIKTKLQICNVFAISIVIKIRILTYIQINVTECKINMFFTMSRHVNM